MAGQNRGVGGVIVHQYDLPAGDSAQWNIIPCHSADNAKPRDNVTGAEFKTMMAGGMRQAKAGESVPVNDAFDTIMERLG